MLLLTALAAASVCGAASAGTGGARFILALDDATARAGELAMLDAEARGAVEEDQAQRRPAVEVTGGRRDSVAVWFPEAERDGATMAAVRGLLAGRHDLAAVETEGLELRLDFRPDLLASLSLDDGMRRTTAMETSVLMLRAMPAGVSVTRTARGAVARFDAAAQAVVLAKRLDETAALFGWTVATGADGSVRVTMGRSAPPPPPARPRRPTDWPRLIEYSVRDALLQPRDIDLYARPEGLRVRLADARSDAAFADTLRTKFGRGGEIAVSIAPARRLAISRLRSGAAPGEGRPASAPDPSAAFHEIAGPDLMPMVEAAVDPQGPALQIDALPDGLEIRHADAALDGWRLAAVSARFAGRQGIGVSAAPGGGVRITPAPELLTPARPTPEALATGIRACLAARRLDPDHVRVLEDGRIEVELARPADAEALRRVSLNQCGFAIRPVDDEAAAADPPHPPVAGSERLVDGRGVALWAEPVTVVAGDMVAKASARTSELTGQPVVSFELTETGRRRFAGFTVARVGRRFAIVANGAVLSVPVIFEPITGGQGEISGDFTPASARELVRTLTDASGFYPLKLVEEQPLAEGGQ